MDLAYSEWDTPADEHGVLKLEDVKGCTLKSLFSLYFLSSSVCKLRSRHMTAYIQVSVLVLKMPLSPLSDPTILPSSHVVVPQTRHRLSKSKFALIYRK